MIAETATHGFLNGLMANKMVFRHEDFGASKVHYGVRADFENSRENWIVGFDISPSRSGVIRLLLIAALAIKATAQ